MRRNLQNQSYQRSNFAAFLIETPTMNENRFVVHSRRLCLSPYATADHAQTHKLHVCTVVDCMHLNLKNPFIIRKRPYLSQFVVNRVLNQSKS